MKKILSIAKNSFLEAIRSNILWSVLLMSLIIILASVAFGSVSVGEQFRVVKSFGYFMISFSGVIISIISGVTLFQKEISQKTIYNILSKSVSRTQFLLGKFLGLWITSNFLVALMMLILQGILLPIEGKLDPLFFHALWCMSWEIAIVSALTVFFSTMAVTPVLPGLFSLAVFISGRSISYLSNYLINKEGTNTLTISVVKILDTILPDLQSFNRYDDLVYGIGLGSNEAGFMIIYAVSYCGLVLVLSGLVFRRREF